MPSRSTGAWRLDSIVTSAGYPTFLVLGVVGYDEVKDGRLALGTPLHREARSVIVRIFNLWSQGDPSTSISPPVAH